MSSIVPSNVEFLFYFCILSNLDTNYAFKSIRRRRSGRGLIALPPHADYRWFAQSHFVYCKSVRPTFVRDPNVVYNSASLCAKRVRPNLE